MDVIECIKNKRSVRAYKDEMLSQEILKELINLGTKASTGSNMQPWAFLSIQGRVKLDGISESIKQDLLEHMEQYPHLQQYKNWLENPKFNVFNNANDLLVIYGNQSSYYYREDCTLAAGNIMLAAHSMGIGSCWIGFAEYYLNRQGFKKEYNIPDEYQLVCAMSLGYKKVDLDPPKRREPLIFWS